MKQKGFPRASRCSRIMVCSRNREQPLFRDKKRLAGSALEKALAGKLSEILSGIAGLASVPLNRHVTNPTWFSASSFMEKSVPSYTCISKATHNQPSSQAWAGQRRHATRGEKAVDVLGAPFVSQRLADVCRQAGWGWYDLSGNCWLDVPGLFRIERTGLPPAHRPPRNTANLSTAAAARVMRALLTPAHAGRTWTQRALQTQTCWKLPNEEPVSLGLVNKVLHYLREQGFVAGTDERGVRVQDPMGLLTAWRDAYRFDRHQRRSFFTLLRGAQLEEALYRTGLDAGGLPAYAAFSAAERQAPQVRQPKTWLYSALISWILWRNTHRRRRWTPARISSFSCRTTRGCSSHSRATPTRASGNSGAPIRCRARRSLA